MTPTSPTPDPERLREAYLDLLRLALCDLIGPATVSAEKVLGGGVAGRELRDEDRALRAEGRDWPAYGLTMTGLRHLSDLQYCVETIVREGIAGDVIECGVWRGGSSIFMRAALDTLGETDRRVWVADSFQGFPQVTRGEEGTYPDTHEPILFPFHFLSVSLDEVQASFDRLGLSEGVRFVPGFFEETMPTLIGRRWSIVRLDSDSYDSTLLALRSLYPGLVPGGFMIVDDLYTFAECRAAVETFRAEAGIEVPIEPVDFTCGRWRKPLDASVDAGRTDDDQTADPLATEIRVVRPVSRPGHVRVPTLEELDFARRVDELEVTLATERARAAATEARQRHEIDTMTASVSWRMTRPLREVRRRVGGRARALRRSAAPRA